MQHSRIRRLGALALALLLLTGCQPREEQPSPGTEESGADRTGTSAPTDSSAAPTPQTTASPVDTTTATPDVTTAPVTPPRPATTAASGELSSETGSNLEIHLTWMVIAETDTTVTIRAEAYLTCYAIWVSARHGGVLKIGNSSQNFSTEAITYEGNAKQTYPLATSTVDVPLGADGTATVELSVSWPFLGSYSGVKIDYLSCSGKITVGREHTEEATSASVTSPAPETTAVPAEVETPVTELGSPILFKSSVYVDRVSSHWSGVTLIQSTAETRRLLDNHPEDCTNSTCAAIAQALESYDDTFFAGKALLLVPQGNFYATTSPVEIFDIRTDDGSMYVHIRDIAASRTTEQLLSTRFYLQIAEIPTDALAGRTICIVQHGVYYTDTGKYERDYLLEAGTVTEPTIRAYAPAAIAP